LRTRGPRWCLVEADPRVDALILSGEPSAPRDHQQCAWGDRLDTPELRDLLLQTRPSTPRTSRSRVAGAVWPQRWRWLSARRGAFNGLHRSLQHDPLRRRRLLVGDTLRARPHASGYLERVGILA
jgi:hypothetical protein